MSADAPAATPVIAIDGPGGAGKGTVSRAVARALGWHYLDSGALYRLVGLAAERDGVALDDVQGLARIAAGLDVRFSVDGQTDAVWLSGSEVTEQIRTERAGAAASAVAVVPAVRQALVARQRAFRRAPGLVADGRDMGAVIFPDAPLKVFLTATLEERIQRRHKQLSEKGIGVSLPRLAKELAERDRKDSERAVAPLRPSQDARILDTTALSIGEVVSTVLKWAAEALPGITAR